MLRALHRVYSGFFAGFFAEGVAEHFAFLGEGVTDEFEVGWEDFFGDERFFMWGDFDYC